MTDCARRIVVTGRVQGVGFRPFVYIKAHELGITGSVLNGSGKVFIHAEGSASSLDLLEHALISAAPQLARPNLASSIPVALQGMPGFEILASSATDEAEIHVPPDLYTCDDCVQELSDPAERRHAYPFINCTQCGPRYTIITAMPYDRPNTSMSDFPLCEDCRTEYESPIDRRFHAQPLACPKCGPSLNLSVGAKFISRSFSGLKIPNDSNCHPHSPLPQSINLLQNGAILAIKGVGGYHLMCDAANDDAINRLRQRKHRPHKPLAVMFPITGEDGMDAIREHLLLEQTTAEAISDPARPIVLVPKREDCKLSPFLAPGLGELGVFLPYSPLHHQLLNTFGRPLVATSGNISGEPVITDNDEAEHRLAGVADAFLHHNRPIIRPADDPVIRPMAGRARVIRLGRGIAPLERQLPARIAQPVVALGGHMKVTIALAWDQRVVISPHIGDLDSRRSNEVFKQIINDIQNLYNVNTQKIICDLHPAYASTRWAAQQDLPVVKVQHHAAHASALAGEHPEVDKWLVFTWDGVGYGSDGDLWGGEALAGQPGGWNRVASFRPFKLVGGDKAGREPWRSAAALMWAEGQDWLPDIAGANLAREAWKRDTHIFQTSAVGRLFDAAAALILGRNMASFEGQGPMELEQIASQCTESINLPLTPDNKGILRSDWAPLLPMLQDGTISKNDRVAIFHASLAQALVQQALALREQYDYQAVGLSGGVFQNRLLTESVVEALNKQGIQTRLHQKIPPNDGGLSFGQIIETARSKPFEAL